jgi:hypothetical protein
MQTLLIMLPIILKNGIMPYPHNSEKKMLSQRLVKVHYGSGIGLKERDSQPLGQLVHDLYSEVLLTLDSTLRHPAVLSRINQSIHWLLPSLSGTRMKFHMSASPPGADKVLSEHKEVMVHC